MAPIKCVIKNAEMYSTSVLKDSHSLLLISVGQGYHENERFWSAINLITSIFGSYTILLADSLQRYTMSLITNINDAEFYHDLANEEGNLWLNRNEKYYNNLPHLVGVTRWDEWLVHPNFLSQKKMLIERIESDLLYKKAFEDTVEKYLIKCSERFLSDSDNVSFDVERAKNLCMEYLVEECTILCLWPELGAQFEIYPAQHNDAMEATRERFIIPYYPDLLQSIRIGFRGARTIRPQKFYLLDEFSPGDFSEVNREQLCHY